MLSISLVIDSEGLKSIKRCLKLICPLGKSSLLTEAIARGLNYNTHASLVAEIRKNSSANCQSNTEAFTNYCAGKGSDISSSNLLLALAQVAIQRVRTNFHLIGEDGYGYGQPKRLNGRWETPKETYDRFHNGRKKLDSVSMAEEFLRSLYFLNQLPQIKTINTKISSYGLKHIAENIRSLYPNGEVLGPHYVCNAALILAAFHLGLKYRTYRDDRGYDSPNMNFNLSHKSIVEIDCKVRPDGARAQDRQRKIEQRGDSIAKFISRQIRQQRKLGNPNFI